MRPAIPQHRDAPGRGAGARGSPGRQSDAVATGAGAQVYSAIFITAALGAVMLARAASRAELVALGLAQAILGVGAIAGLWLVNAVARVVVWTAPGTLLWLAIFAAISGVGLVSLGLAARRDR